MNNENNKCDKYEGFFVFGDEEKFRAHLDECEYCRVENEKYKKVSLLVKEVAPVYLEKESKNKMMTAAKRLACCLIVFVGLTAFTGYKVYDNYTYQMNIEQGSYVTEMGLPIDEYGFLSL